MTIIYTQSERDLDVWEISIGYRLIGKQPCNACQWMVPGTYSYED